MEPHIQLDLTCYRDTLTEHSEPQLVYVMLEASAQGLPAALPRLPLNLCLVIDRSSSMRGERLNHVKAAAQQIVEQMWPEDYFSLVTFNDRAEVMIPAQKVCHKVELKRMIGAVEAAGGTEMAGAIALAHHEIQRTMASGSVSRILLLTDGQTYGDEGRCVERSRRAQECGIGLTALGIGSDWNEDLLETMAARENSRTRYITSAQEITAVFSAELRQMAAIIAQNVQLHVRLCPDAMLRSLDQMQPFIAPMRLDEEHERSWRSRLGDWTGSANPLFLFELLVPPLAAGMQELARVFLRYDLPRVNLMDQHQEAVLRVVVRPPESSNREVSPVVKHWLERLVAYRLQSGAWQNVSAGRVEEASRQLQMAATRLFEAGDLVLARVAEEEATRLLQSGTPSTEGRKQIKYGTRGLVGSEHLAQTVIAGR